MDDRTQKLTPLLQPKRRRAGLVLTTLFSLSGAGGAGYYAWQLRGDNASTTGRLSESEKVNGQLLETLGEQRTSLAELGVELSGCQEGFESAKEESTTLGAELSACQGDVTELETQQAEAKAQLKEFDEFSEKLRKMIDTGKLEVELRRGRMVVKLPAAILFPSGSAELSPDGAEALADVAAVLKTVPKRRFIVAGHTDDIPIKDEHFASNWALSAARAVTVTEALIKAGMKPSTLIAAGYGAYAPVASNNTSTGRQKNRRIEIIVEPDLSKLGSLDEIATKEPAPAEKAAK